MCVGVLITSMFNTSEQSVSVKMSSISILKDNKWSMCVEVLLNFMFNISEWSVCVKNAINLYIE